MSHRIIQKEFTTEVLKYDPSDALEKQFSKALNDDRVIRFVVSSDSVDRDGDVVVQEGIDYKNFDRNPVILLNHNRGGLPIGKQIARELRGNKTVMDIEFPEQGISPKADEVFGLAKAGFMKATSIGFMPKQYLVKEENPNHDLFKRYPDANYVFPETEMLETSIVTVPANADAVSDMVKHYLGKARQPISPSDNPAAPSVEETKQADQDKELLKILKDFNNE